MYERFTDRTRPVPLSTRFGSTVLFREPGSRRLRPPSINTKRGLYMPSVGSSGRPDGRAFSPVVRANSKFFGPGRALCVDVRFKNVEQLDALIAALVKLREFPDDGFDHVHLQDTGEGTARSHPAGAEVTFWHPSVKRDAGAKQCVLDASAFFKALRT